MCQFPIDLQIAGQCRSVESAGKHRRSHHVEHPDHCVFTQFVDCQSIYVNWGLFGKGIGQFSLLRSMGVVGNLREGKSELLNRVAERLADLEDTENGSRCQSLFSTSSALKSHTMGVHVLLIDRRLFYKGGSGFFAICDFEGLASGEKILSLGGIYDAKMFAIAQNALDVLVFNKKGGMDACLMDYLGSFVELGKKMQHSAQGNQVAKQVRKLPLLAALRDFSLTDADPEAYFTDMTKEPQCADDKKKKDFQTVRNILKKQFSDVVVKTLVRPVVEEHELADLKNINFKNLRQAFKTDFNDFFDCLVEKMEEAQHLKGQTFAKRVEHVIKLVNTSQCSSASVAMLVVQSEAVDAQHEALECWTKTREAYAELLDTLSHNDTDDFDDLEMDYRAMEMKEKQSEVIAVLEENLPKTMSPVPQVSTRWYSMKS